MEKRDNFFGMIVRGIGVGVLFTLLSVVVFSIVLYVFDIPKGVVHAVNQFIKFFAVFVGCFFSLKGNLGFLKGAIVGLFIFIITYLVFMLVGGTQIVTHAIFFDLLFGIISGAISGIITVNLKKTTV